MQDDNPEKRYFVESISKKRNRSVISSISYGKAATPFLDDTRCALALFSVVFIIFVSGVRLYVDMLMYCLFGCSEYFSETCRAPEPSTWGLTLGQKFNYPQFPMLDPTLSGPIRPAPVLVRKRQKIREVGSSVQAIGRLLQQTKRYSSELGQKLHFHEQQSESNDASLLQNMQDADVESDRALRMELLIESYRSRNEMALKSITRLEAHYRRYIQSRKYKKFLHVVRFLQHKFRANLNAVANRSTDTLFQNIKMFMAAEKINNCVRFFVSTRIKAAIKMQSNVRSMLQRRRYERNRRNVIRIQSLWKMRCIRQRYVQQRQHIILLQKQFRLYLVTSIVRRKSQFLILGLLKQILFLWELSHESLVHRTRFWLSLRNCSITTSATATAATSWESASSSTKIMTDAMPMLASMSVWIKAAILRREAHRSCKVLGINYHRDLEKFSTLWPGSSCYFIEVIWVPNLAQLLLKSPAARNSPSTRPDVLLTSVANANAVEEQERRELYTSMKSKCSSETLRKIYVRFPGKIGTKLRKRTLSAIVWKNVDSLMAADNAAIATSTIDSQRYGLSDSAVGGGGSSSSSHNIIETLKCEIIQSACSAAAIAILAAARKKRAERT